MLNEEVVRELSTMLQEKFGFATTTQLDRAIAEIIQKTDARQRRGGANTFSLSTMVRGLRAMRGEPIAPKTAESDINYTKALTTGSTPGSYLVPTLQADEIIQYLATGAIARTAGFRIWPCSGIQNLNVPTALASPQWVWMAQNSVQTATDPNLGQMSFSLKERRALIAVPNALLATSVPAFDTLLSQLIGLAAGEHEDTAIFAASTLASAPTAILSASGISTINVGGSASGGNLAYSDILAVLAKASAVKAKPPFVWFASPRTFYSRIMAMLDLSSRPIFIPTLSMGLQETNTQVGTIRPVGTLMGYSVYVTPFIPETQTLGSGTNQASMIFMNPQYGHIAEDGAVEIMVSLERYFDAAQTAIRAMNRMDLGYAPPQGIVALLGVN